MFKPILEQRTQDKEGANMNKHVKELKQIRRCEYLSQLQLDGRLKLMQEKKIKIQNNTNLTWYLLARAISKAYGYEFRDVREDLCIAFVEKYVNNDPRLKVFNPSHLSPEQIKWYKSYQFLNSHEWFKIRYKAIERYGNVCQCCGASKKDGAVIQVDHIKPRSIYPELATDENNLEILCRVCNVGKSSKFATDWR